MADEENEIQEEEGDLFGLAIPLVFVMFLIVGAVIFMLSDEWWPPAIALALGFFWLILSFRIVQPAFAGLVLRFGSRVVLSNGEYLMKKEGWTLICPIVEKIVKISLRQQQQKINGKMAGESEDAYWNRAESFSTAEGVNIFPEIFFSALTKTASRHFLWKCCTILLSAALGKFWRQ
ncbi:MAG: hypothetical protein UV93_C0001G0144 [Candidatus Azambacteria bacterium GW2011_GWC2_43_27]|nr:MAG: hypothetical protein UV93_C0001G0144 [Candidatus Azambacteria bacterium GW2011_GWC2_43_27]